MDLGGGVCTSRGGWVYSKRFKEPQVPTTAAQNFNSDARHSGTRQRRNGPEKTSVCRFGIARTAPAAASSVPASHPRPRGFHAPAWSARLGSTGANDVADTGARSGRKRSSSDWSNSTRLRTPAARSGRAAMVVQGADPRRLCMRIVRYAACSGITMCARVWQVNASETRSRWIATYDAIKSRSSTGSSKSGAVLDATCDGSISSPITYST